MHQNLLFIVLFLHLNETDVGHWVSSCVFVFMDFENETISIGKIIFFWTNTLIEASIIA